MQHGGAELIAAELSNATHVVFPSRLHVQVLKGNNVCALEIMRTFLQDPSTAPSTTCLEDEPVIPFQLPDGTLSDE